MRSCLDLTRHESALQQDPQMAKGLDELPEAVPGPSSKPDSSDCTQPDPYLITSWFQGKSTAELRKLQENYSDIGPILKTYAAISNAHLSRVCKRGKLSGSCLSTLNGFGSTQVPIFLCHIGVPTFSSQNNYLKCVQNIY